MQQLLNFFIRNRHFMLFCVLFIIAIGLTFQSREYHAGKYMNSANAVSGSFYNLSSSIGEYFGLKDNNQLLLEENAQLRSLLADLKNDTIIAPQLDTTLNYSFIPVKVINNSYGRTKNSLTLKGGSAIGVAPEMGVVTSKGIVGIVQKVSKGYSTVMSILNTQSKINAKLANSDHFGTLEWNTQDPNMVQLVAIPRLAPLRVGDTITTGGRSTIFPEGIGIGTIASYQLVEGGNYFEVQVQLFNDMTSLGHGYVIQNHAAAEIKSLEAELVDEE